MSAMKTVFQGLMMSAAPEVDAVALRGGKSTVSIQDPSDALKQSTFMEHQGEVNRQNDEQIDLNHIGVEINEQESARRLLIAGVLSRKTKPKDVSSEQLNHAGYGDDENKAMSAFFSDLVKEGLEICEQPLEFEVEGEGGPFTSISFEPEKIKSFTDQSGFLRFEADEVNITTDRGHHGRFYRQGQNNHLTGELYWSKTSGEDPKSVFCGATTYTTSHQKKSVSVHQVGPKCPKSKEAIAVFNRMEFEPEKTKFSWVTDESAPNSPALLLIQEGPLLGVLLDVEKLCINKVHQEKSAEEKKVEYEQIDHL